VTLKALVNAAFSKVVKIASTEMMNENLAFIHAQTPFHPLVPAQAGTQLLKAKEQSN